MAILEDGTGTGSKQHVDKLHQAHTFAVVESEAEAATDIGDSYNINSGLVACTGTGDSGLIYLKNDEDEVMVITAVAVGVGTVSGTISDSALVTIIRNPTAGTMISDANLAPINSNRNFGSSKTLKNTTLAYGAVTTGETFTDGDVFAILMVDGNERLFTGLGIELQKGSSIGLKIDLNTDGGANVYGAFVVHIKNPDAS